MIFRKIRELSDEILANLVMIRLIRVNKRNREEGLEGRNSRERRARNVHECDLCSIYRDQTASPNRNYKVLIGLFSQFH